MKLATTKQQPGNGKISNKTSGNTCRIIDDTLTTKLFSGDLKDELDKEKESQSAIKRKIEEETKTTGNINRLISDLHTNCFICPFAH